jgi:dolichol-phosphate mannosyltransferase
MKALVTGAGGFLGANLVRHLLAGGHDAVALLRPSGDPWRLAGVLDDAAQVRVDLGDPKATERAVLAERPDVIFHLAAHGAYSWQQDLDAMLAVNIRALDVLLATARQLGAAVVNAGSSSEYGYQSRPPREDHLVRPNSHYAVTKVAGTHLCQLAADRDGVRAVTLRLYSIYGPWEEPGRLIPTLVRRAAAGSWPPLVSPDTARDFVWVGDACHAFVLAATSEGVQAGTIFNVASGIQTTLRELVSAAREVFGVAAEPEWGTMAARAWDTSTWVGDPTAAAEELSWRARTPLGEGLSRMGAWLAEHPELEARYG